METLSSLVIPALLVVAGLLMASGKSSFDVFLKGASEGARTAFSLIPTLCALICALSMFRASGADRLLAEAASPLLSLFGIPGEMIPLAVTRPLSGSASTAAFSSLLKECGADSLPAVCAAILMGSSDTLVYVMGVYFGRTHVKSATRALVIGTLAAILCLFLSCALGRIFFRI